VDGLHRNPWTVYAGISGRFAPKYPGYGEKIPSAHLRLWFLYLIKPFLGVAGGLFFFLVVNLGIVGLFSDARPTFEVLRVLLTAVIGGMFFENVFALLQDLARRASRQEEPNKANLSDPERRGLLAALGLISGINGDIQ
jgi:hypothetical protein